MVYLTKSNLKNQAYILVAENILYEKLLTKISNNLKEYGVWQPKRLFFNTSWWFYGKTTLLQILGTK